MAEVETPADKKYKSLTPPWIKIWLEECILLFRAKSPEGKEGERGAEKKEIKDQEKKLQVLGRFKSVFPFQFFPDELIVEEKRVIWKDWMGPGMCKAISIMATDISNVQASHGPLLGHIHVGSLVGGPEILVEHLWRKDAIKARALIEGIILVAREREAVRKREIEKEKEELTRLGEVKF
jgi:hypothetical protein